MVVKNLNSNFDTPSPITSKPWEDSIIGDINNGERQSMVMNLILHSIY